jgi:hypothetical protein
MTSRVNQRDFPVRADFSRTWHVVCFLFPYSLVSVQYAFQSRTLKFVLQYAVLVSTGFQSFYLVLLFLMNDACLELTLICTTVLQ